MDLSGVDKAPIVGKPGFGGQHQRVSMIVLHNYLLTVTTTILVGDYKAGRWLQYSKYSDRTIHHGPWKS
jgi:hypothetical protein